MAAGRRKRKGKPQAGNPPDILTHLWDADWVALDRDRPATITINGEVFRFDPVAADRVVDFIEEFCRHVEGRCAGKRFVLDPWQRWMVRELFGWKRADGTRRYRKLFLFVARKNGKSTLIAAILLYLLIAEGEKGASIVAAAAEKEQAKLLFNTAKRMVEADPYLSSRCTVYRDYITIDVAHRGDNGKPQVASNLAKVISAEAYSKQGLNLSAAIVDELHVHQDRELLDVLETSMGSRDQPLTVILTTAGIFDKTHVCWQEYDEAKATAADPRHNFELLPVIFEMDTKDELTVENIAKANPGLKCGGSIGLEYLEAKIAKAKRQPSFFNTCLRLHGNVWVNAAERAMDINRWLELERTAPPFPLDRADCVLGVDLSKTTDLSAVVEIYPYRIHPDDETDQHWGVWMQATAWLPNWELEDRMSLDHAPYDLWAKQGYLRLVDARTIDDAAIEEHIRELCSVRTVRKIAMDAWGLEGMGRRLDEDGYPVEAIRQGPKLTKAWQTFEARVIEGTFLHHQNPVADYCVRNVALTKNSLGEGYPSKAKSRGRIDIISAVVTAFDYLMREPIAKPAESMGAQLARHGGVWQ